MGRFRFSEEGRIIGGKTNYILDAVLILATGCIEVNIGRYVVGTALSKLEQEMIF